MKSIINNEAKMALLKEDEYQMILGVNKQTFDRMYEILGIISL